MDKNDMKIEEEAAGLCEDLQTKLQTLGEKGYTGLFLLSAPDGRQYMAQSGNADDLLKLISHAAIPSLVYEESCSKETEGAFLRDVTSTVTENLVEK